MKKLFYLITFVCFIQSCFTGEVSSDSASNNQNQVAVVNIEGMTCAMGCAKAIESNLVDLKGVKSANVDFDNKIAKVEYSKKDLDKAEIIAAIKSTNGGGIYEVTSFELEEFVKSSSETKAKQKKSESDKESEIGSVSNPSEILFEFPSIFTALLNLR